MVATCLVFWTSSNLTSKVRGRGFLFNKYWWMSLSRRSLTHVKFCEPQHFVAKRFKVTTMLYEEMLLVSFVFKQLMIWSIFVHCLPWYKKLPFPIWPVFATHDLESSLLWLLFAKLILVFVVLWNCYNLVFYFFYFLFLRNSYIIFSDLSPICCIMGFQQGNVLEFIANRDAKNSCSSLAWPSLSCVLLLYLSNLLQHSSTGVFLATEKY